MVNKKIMKTRFYKHSALIVFVLLIGLGLSCFVWVRKEQRQYALDRQLIAALVNDDFNQAIASLELGADPNTRLEPTAAPSVPKLVSQMLSHSQLSANDSPTALMLACGAPLQSGFENVRMRLQKRHRTQLVQAILLHGAKANTTASGETALYYSLTYTLHDRPEMDVIKLLLEHGLDPNKTDKIGKNAIDYAMMNGHPDLIVLLRKYSKRL